MGTKAGASITILILLVAAPHCAKPKRNASLDAPREFFGRTRIGSSPDYGIIKPGDDHVITIHGFVDDAAVCHQLARALNEDACKELPSGSTCLNPFTCERLNN